MDKNPFFLKIIEQLQNRQQHNPELYGWKVTINKKVSEQRLLYSNKENSLIANTVRNTIVDQSCSVTVYTRHNDPQVMGKADSKLDISFPLEEQIDAIISNAGSVSNQPWDLVTPEMIAEPYTVKKIDPLLLNDQPLAIDSIVEQTDTLCRDLKGVNVNYAEVFTHVERSLTRTSTGLVIPDESSGIYFEIAMEKLPLPNTQEVHNNRSSLTIEGLQLDKFINATAAETRSLGDTSLPDTDENAVILINAEAITDIMHCLLGQVNASMEYTGQQFLKEGAPVFSNERFDDSDTITISLDPAIDFMAESISFTNEGLVPRKSVIIEKSRVKERVVSNRIGQYLKYPVNPLSGNIIMECGTTSHQEMLSKCPRVIEILKFSALLLNENQLTFSSEIKLAKEFDRASGKTRLLKGGIVSGDIKECLRSVILSRENEIVNIIAGSFNPATGYSGPAYMLLRSGVSISGKQAGGA